MARLWPTVASIAQQSSRCSKFDNPMEDLESDIRSDDELDFKTAKN